MRTLTIISHTEHYTNPDGTIVGLGSTVTEINHLLDVFDEIIHVAMLHKSAPPSGSIGYISNKITFVAIPALGGQTLGSKLSIIWKMPSVLSTVKREVAKSDYFQFRAPTGIGVFVIPYLMLFSSKKGWFKYAGNWKQAYAPLAYRFQKWMLLKQKRKVTINGFWDDQPAHCLSFENPCLTTQELEQGKSIIEKKTITPQGVSFCFVGRVEEAKGIGLLIEAFKSLSEVEQSKVEAIHIVGDGKHIADYKTKTEASQLNFVFHGFLSREQVHHIYKQSHAIVLPSASEGFPKVISEAMNYGCVPIVSDISSISHYIEDEVNGFLVYPITTENLKANIKKMIQMENSKYKTMINSKQQSISKFSYAYYNSRIKDDILS